MVKLAPGFLTDVPGIEVGHAQDNEALTGCTVVLAREGATAGGVVRGLAPGTRETDLLRPGTLVEKAHAVLLAGGSAFGLAAADGVMRFLEERGIGYDTGIARVPIVPAAILFDLGLGNAQVRPDAEMGYRACQAAGAPNEAQGNVGAGCGATVGKLLGMKTATKAGLGMASLSAGRLRVAALMAVNAFGDIVDPTTGAILAGTRNPGAAGGFLGTSGALRNPAMRAILALRNTIIGVVATNACLDVAQANVIASAAHDGLARVVRPAHTMVDGDTIFCLATGRVHAPMMLISELAAEATALAIVNAVWAAEDAGGLPCARTLARTSRSAGSQGL
ncbi:MAG: P1 family peptidase [Chloroflexi bacterium]|nr:P1 family peptidase [Chloroflexota bacterium]